MSALWVEMKVTARTPHAGNQFINSAISQDAKPCHVLLPSIDVCSVSRPPRFVTLIACISIPHVPGAQCKTESNWTWRWYAGRGGVSKRASLELTAGREQRNRHTVHWWSNSAPLLRRNRLRVISDAWIQISKGWKTNTNWNLKFKVRKSELRLTP